MLKNLFFVSVLFSGLFLLSCSKDDNGTNTENTETKNYLSVTIGNQIWMKKNLDVDHYRNGDTIPQVTDAIQWANLKTGAWCYYDNDSANGAIYGKLYNWYAVSDPRGLAPRGYHVPSDTEWKTLSNCLGGDSVAGGKLKTVGTIEDGTGLWFSPNTDATDSSAFSALPSGWHNTKDEIFDFGLFADKGCTGVWWSSTENSINKQAGFSYLFYDYAFIEIYDGKLSLGFSVRCIRDY